MYPIEMKYLTPPTRLFLQKVSKAVFANPFSAEREKADRAIVDSSKSWPALVDEVLEKVKAELDEYAPLNIKQFNSRDQKLLSAAILFERFHVYGDVFDALVANQLAAPQDNQIVPFAKEVLEDLKKLGFDDSLALSYFAFMYQLARAYYLVSRSLVGNSASMQSMRAQLWSSIFTYDLQRYIDGLWNRMEDFSTLLLGETGTGKGVVANALGQAGWIPFDKKGWRFSWAFTQSFISANLSEFTQTLIESALFGHQKGAFTGAIRDSEGLFSRCRPHGTIFLDEIGELDKAIQVKLLRVLQDRVFTPVGGQVGKRFEGRLIAATNIEHASLKEGQFRSDFYYRITSNIIEVPNLRQRILENKNELEELLSVIVPKVIGKEDPDFFSDIISLSQTFRDYHWPGNVRELEQFVRRVLISGTYQRASEDLNGKIERQMSAKALLSRHAMALCTEGVSTSEIARLMQIDRRTALKYLKYQDERAEIKRLR